MKSSCVQHPINEPLIIIRKWQLEFCDGNKAAATLLSFFEYWHNIKIEQSAKSKFQNSISVKHGDTGVQDESLYQFHTEEDLESGVLIYERKAIKRGLDILIDKKVISIHKNPNSKYNFDRTRYFLFYPEILNAWIKTNRSIETPKGRTVVPKREDGGTQKGGAITETTTETTTENISPSLSPSREQTKTKKPEFDFSKFNQEEVEAIQQWLNYRKEIKKPYKTQFALDQLKKKCIEFSKKGILMTSIEFSRGREYIDLYEEQKTKFGALSTWETTRKAELEKVKNPSGQKVVQDYRYFFESDTEIVKVTEEQFGAYSDFTLFEVVDWQRVCSAGQEEHYLEKKSKEGKKFIGVYDELKGSSYV